MINCITRNKIPINCKEDSLTSSVIGPLLHLPANLFWELLRDAIFESSHLPKLSGEILYFSFWPSWSAENGNITNSQKVEPDVFIQFENFDLIIEAKRFDGVDMHHKDKNREQWRNQLLSYSENYPNQKNKFYYLALGGNLHLDKEEVSIELKNEDDENEISIEKLTIPIFKSSWQSLLVCVTQLRNRLLLLNHYDPYRYSLLRVLNDTISGFNLHGFHFIDWLNSITTFSIRKESTATLKKWRING